MRVMNEDLPKRSVILRDIAAALNVHPSTVSRALRGDPRLSPETRDKVTALALEMQYRPNPYLTTLATQVRNHRVSRHRATIAVLDTCQREWEERYTNGITRRAADHGFAVEIFATSELSGGIEEASRIVYARGIRGVVVLPVLEQTMMTEFDFSKMASATIDPSLRHPMLHRACPDYFQGMQLAVDTLHARRYRRIGFCSCHEEIRRIGVRWLGAYLSWQEQGAPDEYVKPHINRMKDAVPVDPKELEAYWRQCRDAFAQWLEQEKPDVIISNSPNYESWLQELGYQIPSDIAFASLGTFLGTQPHATGIDQRPEQVGAAAVDLVASQIYRNEYGIPLIPTTVSVPAVWVDGTTTL